MSPNDDRSREIRHRDLLDRVEAMSARIERLEDDQLAIVDLLRDFRGLVRLLAARVRAQDHRIDEVAARLVPSWGHYERIARHFRN
jgi:hypothetical protein